jgi:hypothetical protein
MEGGCGGGWKRCDDGGDGGLSADSSKEPEVSSGERDGRESCDDRINNWKGIAVAQGGE